MSNFPREVSAGGLVVRKSGRTPARILMIQVRNREGRIVWTFPKGHLEKRESALAAALREVREETGWLCIPLVPRGRPFQSVHYRFSKKGRPVNKTVHWYRMRAARKVSGRDPQEIRRVRWCGANEAKRRVGYPSDIQLLALLQKGRYI